MWYENRNESFFDFKRMGINGIRFFVEKINVIDL